MNKNDKILRRRPGKPQRPIEQISPKLDDPSSKTLEISITDRMGKLFSDTNSVADNFKCGFSIITEKPVYSPGEKICVTVIVSDKMSKKTLSRNQMDTTTQASLLKIEIKDANDGKVSDLAKQLDTESGVIYSEFQTKESFKGGFYSVEIRSGTHLLDKTKFYVTSIRERRNAVIIDLNKDTLSSNDQVVGKVTLKMLTKSDEFFQKGAPGESLNYTVTVCNQDMEALESFKRTLSEGEGIFQYYTPEDLNEVSAIVFLIDVWVEGEKLECSRQLAISSLEDMHLKIVPSSGKFVVGFENEICFGCFSGSEQKVEMALNYGEVIEMDINGEGMESLILKGVSSDETGRGNFKILLKKKKIYQLVVKEGPITRRFNILTKKDLEVDYEHKMAQVLLEGNNRVYSADQSICLSVKKQKHLVSGEFRIVLMDKVTPLFEKELVFEKGEQELKVEIEVEKVNFSVGGVLSAQLYKSSNTSVIIQEYLIYIIPKENLKLGVTFDQDRYKPGDTVNFEITNEDSNAIIGVVVSDETSFLEVERRRLPVSLCSKVFLEKELQFKGGEFTDSSQYIDWFFENNQDVVEQLLGVDKSGSFGNNLADIIQQKKDKLGGLLGIQDWRLFFLEEERLGKFVKNPGTGPLVHSLKNLLPISVERLKNKLFPPLRKFARDNRRFKCGGINKSNSILNK